MLLAAKIPPDAEPLGGVPKIEIAAAPLVARNDADGA